MTLKFTPIEKEFIYVHILFVIICVVVLLAPIPFLIGVKLFILVLTYNIFVVLIGFVRKYSIWLKLWFFVFLVSLFQIFPDWFLSAQLNILVFPEDGFFKIGTVSGYMLGLWAIPLFIISFIALRIKERYTLNKAYIITILLSLVIFGIAEQSMWVFSWYPQNVTLIFEHLAIYIIIPELILGFSTLYFFNQFVESKYYIKIVLAFLIMLLYLGAASFFYFLIEKIIFV